MLRNLVEINADQDVHDRFHGKLECRNPYLLGFWAHFNVVSVSDVVPCSDARAQDK